MALVVGSALEAAIGVALPAGATARGRREAGWSKLLWRTALGGPSGDGLREVLGELGQLEL